MTFDDLTLSDEAYFAKHLPHDIWKHLRDTDPVHLTKSRVGRDYWSVTRHADIQAVLNDSTLFSSQRSGGSLPTSVELTDPTKSEHARLSKAGAMLPVLDPPRHSKVRQPFMKRFAPKVIAALEPRVRDVVAAILEKIPDQNEFDFVVQVAARLPSSMVFLLMDIPESDWEMMFRLTNMHTAPNDPEFSIGTALETREQGVRGTVSYCRDLALERRKNPGDDLISHIATLEVDGERLSDDELGFMGHMFIVAGQETTRNSLSAGLHQLMQQPEDLQRLRQDRTLLKTVPDEFIRWANPVVHLLRTATATTELGGRTIHEGDWVVCWLASGNRDERAFVDPFRFDLARSPNPHLSFGFGPHFCIGGFLARLQIRIMLEGLLDRFDRFDLRGPPEHAASIQLHGIKHLPVAFARQPAAAEASI